MILAILACKIREASNIISVFNWIKLCSSLPCAEQKLSRQTERERARCVCMRWTETEQTLRERDVCACWTETEQTDGERKRCVHVLGKQDLVRHYQRFSEGAFTPDANKSREVARLNILSLLASFERNLCHSLVKFTTQQTRIRVMGGASARQLQSRCKMYSCFCKSTKMYIQLRDPHTTTITLSSIVVSDFLPPLVMTSLLEQAPDWLTWREYPPKFRFFNSRHSHLVWMHLETK